MSDYLPRYLVPFHPKRLPHYFADVLIVGGGLAGLRAANEVPDHLSVLVVTKDSLQQSNSNYAQGGIAGVLAPDDRFEDHVADTLTAGGSLCDREIVSMVIREAPDRIHELIRWGTQFDRQSGELELGREGGHSRHRIVHALGDATGKEVMRAVIERTKKRPNVQIWENSFTLDLLSDETGCRGALVSGPVKGHTLVWSKQTILCTGGAGQLYRESTNPSVATGDGLAAAFRAGAELRDMEFFQFHPTVLYIAGSSRSLITEAIRGEGAHLVDRRGHRFMLDYDERAELAPRDVVSHAIVQQMERTRHPNVYLDLSHLDPQLVLRRFPGIAETCSKFGLDITSDRIPVRPGAHYFLGGLTVDADGQTTLPGLWAAGEVSSTGLHGANRLASNSLLESLVYGVRAGAGAGRAADAIPDDFRAVPMANSPVEDRAAALDLADIRNSLQSLMWHAAGVQKSADQLSEAGRTIDHWRKFVLASQFQGVDGWELQNMLTVGRVIVEAANVREESRGVHLRSDFPQAADAWEGRRIRFSRSAEGTVVVSPE